MDKELLDSALLVWEEATLGLLFNLVDLFKVSFRDLRLAGELNHSRGIHIPHCGGNGSGDPPFNSSYTSNRT